MIVSLRDNFPVTLKVGRNLCIVWPKSAGMLQRGFAIEDGT
jgi:hypothetical protein